MTQRGKCKLTHNIVQCLTNLSETRLVHAEPFRRGINNLFVDLRVQACNAKANEAAGAKVK